MCIRDRFNTPEDKLLFDVSHQAYIHKMLTGRLERMETIRQPGGLNGFMLRTESEHDCYGAGHAGTALSAALGMAVADVYKRQGLWPLRSSKPAFQLSAILSRRTVQYSEPDFGLSLIHI